MPVRMTACGAAGLFIVKLQFQKRSVLNWLVEQSREAEGTIPRSLLRNISKACFGVHTRD